MPLQRRHLLLTALSLPAGCSLQRLPDLPRRAVSTPSPLSELHPPEPGQQWTYRQMNVFNGMQVGTLVERRADGDTHRILRRTGSGHTLSDELHAAWGELRVDPGWDVPLHLEQPLPVWPQRLEPQRWATRTHYREPGGSYRYWVDQDAQLVGWERVQVPAGEFVAARIERRLRLQHPDPVRLETRRRQWLWLAPEVGRWVARETTGQYTAPSGDRGSGDVYLEDHFRWELTGWSKG